MASFEAWSSAKEQRRSGYQGSPLGSAVGQGYPSTPR